MAKTRLVHVTEDLVKRATQRDSQHCMIAEAIKRSDPEIKSVWVDIQTMRWSDMKRGVRVVALTPVEAATALIAFDRGKAEDIPASFSFKCKIIQETPLPNIRRDDDGNIIRGTSGRPLYKRRAGRKRWKRSEQIIEGGDVGIPLAHLGGSHVGDSDGNGERALARRQPTYRAKTLKPIPEGASNVELSKQAYRQFGRRLLKE